MLGHRQKTVCTEWDSQEFFREMGRLLQTAERWTNLEITNVGVEKVLDESSK